MTLLPDRQHAFYYKTLRGPAAGPMAACPHCRADVRAPASVRITTLSPGGKPGPDYLTCLDPDGRLVDTTPARKVEIGDTVQVSCVGCGQKLHDHDDVGFQAVLISKTP